MGDHPVLASQTGYPCQKCLRQFDKIWLTSGQKGCRRGLLVADYSSSTYHAARGARCELGLIRVNGCLQQNNCLVVVSFRPFADNRSQFGLVAAFAPLRLKRAAMLMGTQALVIPFTE
jgi:hypothetical protein